MRAEQSRAEQSMSSDKRDLVVLATEVAQRLVGAALEQLLVEAVAVHDGSGSSVSVQLQPGRPVKALPPAPAKRRGRKPGPKPGKKRKYTKRVMSGRVPPPAAPAGSTPAARSSTLDVASRKCRKCQVIGHTERVPGSDRELRCTKCGHRWNLRRTAAERAEPPSIVKQMRRPKAAPREACCGRCDHDQSAHEQNTGKCLVPRCVCQEFYK